VQDAKVVNHPLLHNGLPVQAHTVLSRAGVGLARSEGRRQASGWECGQPLHGAGSRPQRCDLASRDWLWCVEAVLTCVVFWNSDIKIVQEKKALLGSRTDTMASPSTTTEKKRKVVIAVDMSSWAEAAFECKQ